MEFFFVYSAGQTTIGKSLPPPTTGQTAKSTQEQPQGGEVPRQQTPKPSEVPQNHPGTEMPLPQITTDDLRTEGLEPRFNPSIPRVPVQVPVPVPVPVTGKG